MTLFLDRSGPCARSGSAILEMEGVQPARPSRSGLADIRQPGDDCVGSQHVRRVDARNRSSRWFVGGAGRGRAATGKSRALRLGRRMACQRAQLMRGGLVWRAQGARARLPRVGLPKTAAEFTAVYRGVGG